MRSLLTVLAHPLSPTPPHPLTTPKALRISANCQTHRGRGRVVAFSLAACKLYCIYRTCEWGFSAIRCRRIRNVSGSGPGHVPWHGTRGRYTERPLHVVWVRWEYTSVPSRRKTLQWSPAACESPVYKLATFTCSINQSIDQFIQSRRTKILHSTTWCTKSRIQYKWYINLEVLRQHRPPPNASIIELLSDFCNAN